MQPGAPQLPRELPGLGRPRGRNALSARLVATAVAAYSQDRGGRRRTLAKLNDTDLIEERIDSKGRIVLELESALAVLRNAANKPPLRRLRRAARGFPLPQCPSKWS